MEYKTNTEMKATLEPTKEKKKKKTLLQPGASDVEGRINKSSQRKWIELKRIREKIMDMKDKGDKKSSITGILEEGKTIELKNYSEVELEKTTETNQSTE